MKAFLKVTGLTALGLSTILGFADLKGWLTHSDREALLEWFLEANAGLPIQEPAARAFQKSFPPPPEASIDEITHLTKQVIRSENGPVMDGSVNYMHRDTSRTRYVATLAQVREWAAESRYPWIAWALGLIGFLEVLASTFLDRKS